MQQAGFRNAVRLHAQAVEVSVAVCVELPVQGQQQARWLWLLAQV
jgi:hypothetical protein